MQERIARNDSTFRDANEQIRAAADRHGVDDIAIPFICECADPTCQEIVRLTRDQYGEVRGNARHFLNAPGHQRAALGAGEVVAERDGYVIVEKIAYAGELAEALDDEGAADARAAGEQ